MGAKRFHKRRKKRPLEDSSEVLYRALRQAGLTEQARRLRIFGVWKEAVGDEIAARCLPDRFSRGVLIVKVASPAWQNELVFLRATIVEKLNALLGRPMVKEFKVICGHMPKKLDLDAPRPRPAPSQEDYAQAEAYSTPIKDPDIRKAFEHLAAVDHYAKRTRRLK